MTRRVVFVGSTQTKSLARVYRSEAAAESDEVVAFVGTDALGREAARRVVAAAEVLVVETGDLGDALDETLLPDNAEIIRVPKVEADFLWPFAGRPHPRNAATPSIPEGPYPADNGDSFLDRMMQEGVDEDEAVARYLALDMAQEADLDRRLRERLERQASVDQRTGHDLASFIEGRFREVNLFGSLERARLPLVRRIAAEVFRRLGAPESIARGLRSGPFARSDQPVHPGIIAHFSITAIEPGTRYAMLGEGRFTFEEYCRRYVRFTWNEALHAAIALAETDPVAAIPGLREGLAVSPDSRAGKRALQAALKAAETPASQPGSALVPVPVEPQRPREPLKSETGQRETGQRETGQRETGQSEPRAAAPFLPVPYQPLDPPVPGVFPGQSLAPYAEPAPPAETHSGVFDPGIRDDVRREDAASAPYAPIPYIELPPAGAEETTPEPAARITPDPRAYTPLPPSQDLIEVLPRLLQPGEGLAGTTDIPFANMAETMPPPPLRPVLPPELQPEPPRRTLIARLFGRGE